MFGDLWYYGVCCMLTGAIMSDKSKRKTRDELERELIALQKRCERQEVILNAIPELILVLTRDGIYTAAYPTDNLPMPIPTETLVGNHLKKVVSATFYQKLERLINEAFENETVTSIENRYVYNEQVIYYETNIIPVGQTMYIIKVRNITPRRTAAAGRTSLTLALYENLKAHLTNIGELDYPQASPATSPYPLDETERFILFSITQGLTNAEIGVDLNVSTSTVANRLTVIYKKLGVKNRTQAISLVLGGGLDTMLSSKE